MMNCEKDILLELEISDYILEVAECYNDVTQSDLQAYHRQIKDFLGSGINEML